MRQETSLRMRIKSLRIATLLTPLLILLSSLLLVSGAATAQTPTLPNETPNKFEPTNDGFDYIRRDVMIPMRDRVQLHTVILIPKGANRAPIGFYQAYPGLSVQDIHALIADSKSPSAVAG